MGQAGVREESSGTHPVGLPQAASEEFLSTELTSAYDLLKRVRVRFTRHDVSMSVRALRTLSRAQGLNRTLRLSCLKELSRMKQIEELMDFDWDSES